ncbi:FMN-dependent NADH-azoreductase [Piscinibacter koreensis]|uniref:FMN dependent NADH:quinone oxidoreductase n=1 Tax=Piscinibacter koreensis TaxID=2742824 RepID=A0A7Y6TY92_9BURK|nr:NAD(P)H-dependent oxidoreductase [Schlegelella koreensis]NUZ07862.1 NAD(P)H-dependent oxidoreductase [Schlegelella koreensis]
MKLLHVDSSPLGSASVSRALGREVVAQWTASHPGTRVEYLDLVTEGPAHLDADALGFRLATGAAPTPAQQRENALTERLVSQFLAADVVVIGAPMVNFGVTSQLKAWIDRIAQAGRTFRYTAAGPEGLATGKTVIVVSTRGGRYAGVPAEAMDHQESYLKAVLGFFGIADVRIVRAEGLSMGDEAKARALAAAAVDIRAHTARAANEAAAALAA